MTENPRPMKDNPLGAFLDALASSAPVPAGGAAAALAGAAGASLLVMVAALPKAGGGRPDAMAALAGATAALHPLRQALADAIERDCAAYGAIPAALRMERETSAQRTARDAAIQAALRGATEAPLDTLRLCRQALGPAAIVAAHAPPAARSDVAVAVELLAAAARSAAHTIDANLARITDATVADAIRAERRRLADECATDAETTLQLLTA